MGPKVSAPTNSAIKSYLLPPNPIFELASKLQGKMRQQITFDGSVGWS
jgi:hypothetical protein